MVRQVERDCWTRMKVTKRRANPGIPDWFFQPGVLQVTDKKGVALIEQMWGHYRELKKLEEDVRAATEELKVLRREARSRPSGGRAVGGAP
jgi:hypothetical protein